MKMLPRFAVLFLLITAQVSAQTAEIKLTFDEQFFDALLESVFTKLQPPSVPLTSVALPPTDPAESRSGPSEGPPVCKEAVTVQREVDGVRTAVRFRQGKIYAPIAFSGNYNPPLIGCIEFRGWAETNIKLQYDSKRQALVANATVVNVNLSGTGGVGGDLIARMVQNSIDSKINPIEIVSMDKLSFTFPIRESGNLRMNALGIRHQVNERSVDVFVNYEFRKAP